MEGRLEFATGAVMAAIAALAGGCGQHPELTDTHPVLMTIPQQAVDAKKLSADIVDTALAERLDSAIEVFSVYMNS